MPDTEKPAGVLDKAKATLAKLAAHDCPHCGSELREHGDSLNALHCDDTRCVGCCFVPTKDGVELRPGSNFCPQAGKADGAR
jgi:hypothetical protein